MQVIRFFIKVIVILFILQFVFYCSLFKFASDYGREVHNATKPDALVCWPSPEHSNPTNDWTVRMNIQASISHCIGELVSKTNRLDRIQTAKHYWGEPSDRSVHPIAFEYFLRYAYTSMRVCLYTARKSEDECMKEMHALYRGAFGVEYDPVRHDSFPDESYPENFIEDNRPYNKTLEEVIREKMIQGKTW